MHPNSKSYLLTRPVAIFQVLSHDHISWIYRNLGCQYHLIQDEDLKKTPTIPALTPIGFSRWMTLFVLAYPNEESQRFDKVVLMMPIDAKGASGEKKPQRLPKQLSRYLLPPNGNHELKKLLRVTLPGLKNFATSSQTSSKVPIVNSKTSSTKHHDDAYSRDLQPQRTPPPHQAWSQIDETTPVSTSVITNKPTVANKGRKKWLFMTEDLTRIGHRLGSVRKTLNT